MHRLLPLADSIRRQRRTNKPDVIAHVRDGGGAKMYITEEGEWALKMGEENNNSRRVEGRVRICSRPVRLAFCEIPQSDET